MNANALPHPTRQLTNHYHRGHGNTRLVVPLACPVGYRRVEDAAGPWPGLLASPWAASVEDHGACPMIKLATRRGWRPRCLGYMLPSRQIA